MGLDANYPAVTMNDPNGHVTVYNQDHLPIGQLGPTPFESPSVNVTCKRKAWDDAYWYRLLNPEGWPFPADEAYVAADETHELNPGQPYPIPECASGARSRSARPRPRAYWRSVGWPRLPGGGASAGRWARPEAWSRRFWGVDLAKLLKVAEAAVDRGRVITDSRGPGALTSKGDRDMASEVDFAVEREVRAFLERETPEIGVLGEEEGGATDGTRWVLDPIDGTVNFVHGVPLWCISLGLIHEGRAVAGVIDHPALGTRYAAADGLGATCNGKPIRGSECTDLADALVAVGDYAVGPDAERINAERFALDAAPHPRVQRLRMIGTAATALTWTADRLLRRDDHVLQQALGHHGRRQPSAARPASPSWTSTARSADPSHAGPSLSRPASRATSGTDRLIICRCRRRRRTCCRGWRSCRGSSCRAAARAGPRCC